MARNGRTGDTVLAMISEEEAREKILTQVHSLPSRRVSLLEALDRFAAEDLTARMALPIFDNSAMDGYAVVSDGCAPGDRLKVSGEQPAGRDRRLSVQCGQAARIFTGAPMPEGADAVIMQEDVVLEGDEIVLQTAVEAGEFVRRRGGDIAEGQRMITKGDRVTPQKIALLAAQGVGTMVVGGRVSVALISTGDELAPPEAKLAPGQIYESNSLLLHALLQKCGAGVASTVHCVDRADQIEAAVRTGTACDVMIITGGVSVGARDFVKEAIGAAGGVLDLWRVSVKPGKPFLFGRAGACSIFGLPGNPVSAFVTFLLFVRPALLRLMGAGDDALGLPQREARIEAELANDGERPHYLRGSLRGGVFHPKGRQESHALFGLSRADALCRLHPGEKLARGATVTISTWD